MADNTVSHRYRPGNSGDVGQTLRTDFTVTSTAAIALPNRSVAAGENNPERYVDFYTTAPVDVVFGSATVEAATNNDALFVPEMGYISFMLTNRDTHYRIKGDAGSGTTFTWFSGN